MLPNHVPVGVRNFLENRIKLPALATQIFELEMMPRNGQTFEQ